MVPWTLNVHRKALKDNSDVTLFVVLEGFGRSIVRFEIKQPSGIGKKFEVEYWRTQPERDDKKFANLEKKTIDVVVGAPFDAGHGMTCKVKVPVLVVSKSVAPDVELKFYEPKESKKRKTEFDVSSMSGVKSSK